MDSKVLVFKPYACIMAIKGLLMDQLNSAAILDAIVRELLSVNYINEYMLFLYLHKISVKIVLKYWSAIIVLNIAKYY